jgi:hypothetical protein
LGRTKGVTNFEVEYHGDFAKIPRGALYEFTGSKIGIQRVYFTRWHVHNRGKYTKSIAFALHAHDEVYQKDILSKRIAIYFACSVYGI